MSTRQRGTTALIHVLSFAAFAATTVSASVTDNPLGACVVGAACQMTTEADCISVFGGVYQGDFTTCPGALSLYEPGQNGELAAVVEPIYLFSGEFYQSVVDLRIPGRGLDFVWRRKYRSRVGPDVGMGNGWDYAYDIRVFEVGRHPSEITGLRFVDDDTIVWNPPTDPGGPLGSLRYCTLRSTDPADFADPAVSMVVDPGGLDPSTDDPAMPPSGVLYSYLVAAYNEGGDGPLGTRSNGLQRVGRSCAENGPNLLLLDGNTRRDTYTRAAGIWTTAESFKTIERAASGGYLVRFPDASTWELRAMDGSPAQGKIDKIADPRGNTLHFAYDGAGRLISVLDTLGRTITVGYDGNGFIGTVTDFAGRQVHYEYYNGIEPGGSAGDLKRVTTPAVTGTPNGNDFPAGKTTTYTYTAGFFDKRLNSNLLTITDAKGQTYLVNEYDPTTDPSDLNFDRVKRQTWGVPGDVIDLVYRAQVPGPANGFSVLKAVVNDRVGNVSEYLFDDRNRCIRLREYTGRANPDVPTDTDLGINLPVAPLRPDDPPYFETRFEWNPDALALRVVHPNLNETVSTFDSANPDRRSQGNLVQLCRVAGPLGGDAPQLCETFEYDPVINHGTNQVTRKIDARGAQTTDEYDATGNRTRRRERVPTVVDDYEYNAFGQITAHVLPDNGSGSRRRDEYTYHASGPQMGYRQQEIRDALHSALTTTFEYDAVGNVVRVIDPRGHDSLFTVNQLDQVVRSRSREVTDGSGVRYQVDLYYDANDNVVRQDVSNVNDQGVLQANAQLTKLTDYDIHNETVRVCAESGSVTLPSNVSSCAALTPAQKAQFATEEYERDANSNRTLIRRGEAVNGNQPTNRVAMLYDERNLLFRELRGDPSGDVATTQFDYDGNRNLERTTYGPFPSRVAESTINGFERLFRVTDPMGNVTEYHYDPNLNLASSRVDGEIMDLPGGAGNVRLSESTYVYDPMDRMTRVTAAFFDPQTQAPIPGGQVLGSATTAVEYSDAGQITRVVDDNLHDLKTAYDTANRKSNETDAKGNKTTYTYDASSNVTRTDELEKSDLFSPDQTFATNFTYDNLDRRTSRIDAIGNTTSYGYDSRDNRTVTADPLGVQVRNRFDGLNRLVETVRDMNGNGASAGDSVDIVTGQGWDASSRLVSQTDDSGNVTTYQYDDKDRRIRTTGADGTFDTVTYDVHDNVASRLDAMGSSFSSTHDLLNRLVSKSIAPGPGVSSETTFESYQYDGKSRLIQAQDDDSLVTFKYDSLSDITGETLFGLSTTSVFDGVGNQLSATYPGGRVVTTIYDALDRKTTISDGGGLIATYWYRGPGRVERRDYGNGTRTDYQYDGIPPNPVGDFGRKRIVRTLATRIAGGAILDDRTYAWDRAQNQTRRTDVRIGGPRFSGAFTYDAASRLTHSTVSNAVPTVVRDTGYVFDGVGNRTSVTGTLDPGSYTLDPTQPVPADRQMNQYSVTPFDTRQYDANGNLIAISPGTSIVYNYRNQMVDYFSSTGQHHVYRYDALGRRIVKIVDVSGAAVETRCFRNANHVVEEQDGAGATRATYIVGEFTDEFLNMVRFGASYYYHADNQRNIVALSDLAGNIVERYEYTDYGVPEFRNATGNTVLPVSSSPVGNPFLFQGRRYDAETGWYCHRARHRDPRAGKWTTREPLGPWGDTTNVGNDTAFVGNNPWSRWDPSGEAGESPDDTAKAALKEAETAYDKAATALAAAQKAEKAQNNPNKEMRESQEKEIQKSADAAALVTTRTTELATAAEALRKAQNAVDPALAELRQKVADLEKKLEDRLNEEKPQKTQDATRAESEVKRIQRKRDAVAAADQKDKAALKKAYEELKQYLADAYAYLNKGDHLTFRGRKEPEPDPQETGASTPKEPAKAKEGDDRKTCAPPKK